MIRTCPRCNSKLYSDYFFFDGHTVELASCLMCGFELYSPNEFNRSQLESRELQSPNSSFKPAIKALKGPRTLFSTDGNGNVLGS